MRLLVLVVASSPVRSLSSFPVSSPTPLSERSLGYMTMDFEDDMRHGYRLPIPRGDAQSIVVRPRPMERPGILELTKNEIRGDVFSVGRASYALPVPLWDDATGELASFTTNFTFQIKPKEEKFFRFCNGSGDGMAFFLAHYPSRIPPNSYGWNLALFNDSNNYYATGDSRVVAVEFDTWLSEWDKSRYHMGIDVNSIDSKAYVNVTKGLVSEDANMTAKISYNNLTGILAAHLQIDYAEPYSVSSKVDMKGSLPEEVAVGFSAATGTCIKLHQVLSWSFSSTLGATSSPEVTTGARRRLVPVLVPVSVGFLASLCAVAVGCLVRRRRIWKKLQETTDGGGDSDGEQEQAEYERGVGPRRYRYHELAAATGNFAEEEKLGRARGLRQRVPGHPR
ncbi:Agglutinin-2 [Dichanthelium oligosanthes]|uniref:Agglutinin-2 n=1 Tax=Dichanthelium oligosanthes TaxID=888268 RepID=A0A1E5UJK7_9POAL|nr:Agglutinin-2 [Dichanthelium oligosanthes]